MPSVNLQQATEYFAKRLNTSAWDDASRTDKQKALAQAGREIATVQMSKKPPTSILTAAVCEQALFLLSKTPDDLERIRVQQTGVKFRWVGDAREDYSGVYSYICSEAMQVIGPYVQYQRKFGGIR